MYFEHLKKRAGQFLSRVQAANSNGCMIWAGAKARDGYGVQYLGWKDGRTKTGKRRVYAHRAALMLHLDRDLSTEEIVRHKCDTPLCCNPLHMELGTHADNVQDKVSRGRQAKGTANGRSVLTPDAVRSIRADIRALIQRYADSYSVDPSTIRHVVNGKTWADVQ